MKDTFTCFYQFTNPILKHFCALPPLFQDYLNLHEIFKVFLMFWRQSDQSSTLLTGEKLLKTPLIIYGALKNGRGERAVFKNTNLSYFSSKSRGVGSHDRGTSEQGQGKVIRTVQRVRVGTVS